MHFLQIYVDLSKKSKSKQFIYFRLKDLIKLFQKIVWFIGVWATIHEIVRNKLSKKVLNKWKINGTFQIQTLISSI